MTYRELHLTPVDIGGGLVATDAWVSKSPIVLIVTHDGKGGREIKSRLDLQKRAFLDPLPGDRDIEGVLRLVKLVISAYANPGPQRIAM